MTYPGSELYKPLDRVTYDHAERTNPRALHPRKSKWLWPKGAAEPKGLLNV